jgi:phosphoserine phosphatase
VAAFGIPHLIATEPEVIGSQSTGQFTGKVAGLPNFREGKVTRLENWLQTQNLSWEQLSQSYFYSDSINDLPLLQKVTHPIATNPDSKLRAEAEKNNWSVLELFA